MEKLEEILCTGGDYNTDVTITFSCMPVVNLWLKNIFILLQEYIWNNSDFSIK